MFPLIVFLFLFSIFERGDDAFIGQRTKFMFEGAGGKIPKISEGDFQVDIAVSNVNPVGTCACRDLNAAVRGFEPHAD